MTATLDKSKLLFDNRYLRQLIIPLLIETLLSVTIGMMDTIMVSTVGEHAVSGVSLVDSVANLFVFLFSRHSILERKIRKPHAFQQSS